MIDFNRIQIWKVTKSEIFNVIGIYAMKNCNAKLLIK